MTRKYHLFDAKGNILGRVSTQIAKILSGRNNVNYAPNADGGDFVAVINSDEVRVTGDKEEKKMYHHYSGYPGGVKSLKLKDKMKKDSKKIIREAVYGMLPKNKLRDKMIRRLLVFTDEKHNVKIDIRH